MVGTSLLCVAFLVSRDTISLEIVSDETSSNENVFLLSNISLIICMLVWFMVSLYLFDWFLPMRNYILMIFIVVTIILEEEGNGELAFLDTL